MNSGGSKTASLNNECVRLQLFRCSFEIVKESLGTHFRLEDIEKELGKVCNKEKMKKIYEHMMESMKKDLSESLSEFITDGINCKLKILEEVTKEGVYDAQPKWRPFGNVQNQVIPHIIAEKLTLKEQLERDLEKETAEVHRLKEKIAMKRKMHLQREKKYTKLGKRDSSIYSNLESLAVLEKDILSNMIRKFDEFD